jgi:hypothetical protein
VALHEGAHAKGHSLLAKHFVGALPGRGRTIESLSTGNEGIVELQAALLEPAWVIVNVCGPRWVSKVATLAPPAPSSPHGPLCPPGTWGGPFHAVLLTGCSDDGESFTVLDPFFLGGCQPFAVTADELVDVLAGYALIAPLP